jgi:hypothetical protein
MVGFVVPSLLKAWRRIAKYCATFEEESSNPHAGAAWRGMIVTTDRRDRRHGG